MKSWNSMTPYCETWLLPLSLGSRTSLKSPNNKHGDFIATWNYAIIFHISALSSRIQGLYTFIMQPLKSSDGICPSIAIQFLSTLWDSIVKKSVLHIDNKPLEFLIEGVNSQSTFTAFHIVFIILGLKLSIFVSWMKMILGSWEAIIFLRELFFILALRPLIFHDIIIISGF